MPLRMSSGPNNHAFLDSANNESVAANEDRSSTSSTSAIGDVISNETHADQPNSPDRSSAEPASPSLAHGSKPPAVFGPELPPSMVRTKGGNKVIGGAILSSMANLSKITTLLSGENRKAAAGAEHVKRTENELQCLFHSRLLAIMNRYGYKNNEFTEKDIARVMVSSGLMNSMSDDPMLAMASELEAEMTDIVQTNMRRMTSSMMGSEFLTDITVDPAVIGALSDMGQPDSTDPSEHPMVSIENGDVRIRELFKTISSIAVADHFPFTSGLPKDPRISVSPSAPKSAASSSASISRLPNVQCEANTKPAMPASTATAGDTNDMFSAAFTRESPKAHSPVLQPPTLAPDTETSTAMAADAVGVVDAREGVDALADSDPSPKKKKKKRKNKSKKSKGKEPEVKLGSGLDFDSSLGVVPMESSANTDTAPADSMCIPAESPKKLVKSAKAAHSQLCPQPALPATAPTKPSRNLCKTPMSMSTFDSSMGFCAEGIGMGKPFDPRSDKLWSTDLIDEQKQVRKFWLDLTNIERRMMVLIEKGIVLARVQEHQNFSCSCNVCTRKREAIEHELDSLYDCYYDELQESVRRERMRIVIRSAEKRARSIIISSVEAIADSVLNEARACKKPKGAEDLKKAISEIIKRSEPINAMITSSLKGSPSTMDSTLQQAAEAAAISSSSSGPSEPKEKVDNKSATAVEKATMAIKEWADGALEYRREFGDEPFHSDAEGDEPFSNNDLFYTESMLDTIDAFPTDSKKFFDMMERLAEYRMRQEDAMVDRDADSDFILDGGDTESNSRVLDNGTGHAWPRRSKDLTIQQQQQQQQRRCPDCHGEISEAEEQAAGYSSKNAGSALRSLSTTSAANAVGNDLDLSELESEDPFGLAMASLGDADDGEDDDDLYDSVDGDDLGDDVDLEDTDDDFDELDIENVEREAEEGRRVFQLFAARLFEQRVIGAYREKVARDRQQLLIQELEEEEKRHEAKEKRKQKKKERERERKRQIQAKKEEAMAAKEAHAKAEQERKRLEDERRRNELMQKRREQEEKAKKAQEERNRRILEEADKRMERERLQRMRQEAERQEKEERKRRELELKRQQEAENKEREEKKRAESNIKAQATEENKNKKAPAAEVAAPATPAVAPVRSPAAIQATAEPSSTRLAPNTPATVSHSAALSSSVPASAPAFAAADVVPVSAPLSFGTAAQPHPQLHGIINQLPQLATTLPASVPVHSPAPSLTPVSALASGPALGHGIGHNAGLGSVALDPLQIGGLRQPLMPAPSPTSPVFKIPNPPHPMLHSFNMGSPSPTAISFGLPIRVRANSGSNLQHPQLHNTATTPTRAAITSTVSPEIDAEIMSIVGRVMGSSNLQDGLVDGAEWRTEPAESFSQAQGLTPLLSASRASGVGIPTAGSLSDMAFRRNSMPLNRLIGETIGSGSPECAAVRSHHTTLGFEGEDVDGIYPAYCALERFRRSMPAPSGAAGSDIFGSYQSAADIAKMHGKIREVDAWNACVKLAQSYPNNCRLNHTLRSASFARTGGGGANGMSPSIPAASAATVSFASRVGNASGSAAMGHHLSSISEDMLSAFSLQPSQPDSGGSPLMANIMPRSMSLAHGQPISRDSQQQHQHQQKQQQQQSSARPLIMTSLSMSIPTSMQSPFGQQQPVHSLPFPPQPQMTTPHSGMNYSPITHQSPTASLFFNQPGVQRHHGGSLQAQHMMGPHPSFALPSFQHMGVDPQGLGFGISLGQQPAMSNSWSPAKTGLESGLGHGDLAQQATSFRSSMQPQLQPLGGFVTSQDQHQNPGSQF
ncbi:Stress response protein nst1 [Coemansia sp. Benny D115]|nr:Stress response protein nst1 [Coemansia sp. Benny D115]